MNIQKNAFFRICAVVSAAISLTAVSAVAGPLVNQLGFAPDAEKIVVYPGSDANGLEVRDLNGKTVLKLDAPMVYDWDFSGEEVQTFDISALKVIWVHWIRELQAFCPWRLGKVRNCSIF